MQAHSLTTFSCQVAQSFQKNHFITSLRCYQSYYNDYSDYNDNNDYNDYNDNSDYNDYSDSDLDLNLW